MKKHKRAPKDIITHWLPPAVVSVSEWADAHRILPSGYPTPEVGKWRTHRTPPLRGIQDAFSDHHIEKIVVCKGSQIGGTEAIYNMVLFAISEDPGPMMVVMPTEDLAKSISQVRIQPSIRACEPTAIKMPVNLDKFRVLEMELEGMTLTLIGSNSPANLASKPIRYLFLDETDKYPSFAGKEADPISLALERQKTFWNKKTVIISTPTLDTGFIWRELKSCDSINDYWVPCPHCGAFQVLKFENIIWEKFLPGADKEASDYFSKVHNVAVYQCANCEQFITNQQRPMMLSSGEWRARNPVESPRSIGFHLPSFYSSWLSWGDMAEIFLRGKDYPDKFQNVVNSWWALPWTQGTTEETPDNLLPLVGQYAEATVPAEAVILTAGVDVQAGFMFYVIRAWAKDGESWLIKYGQVESFNDLEALFWGQHLGYLQESTKRRFLVSMAAVDSGYRTHEVYDFVRRHHDRARAVKGASVKPKAPVTGTRIDYYPDGKVIPGGMVLWSVDTDYFKTMLTARMAPGEGQPVKWHIPPNVTQQYADQVTAEHKIKIRGQRTGRITEEWRMKEGHKHNHLFDAEVYALAASYIAGIQYQTVIQEQARVDNVQAKSPFNFQNQRGWFKN